MKLSIKPKLLKILTLCAGILGLLLRTVLYATGIDEKGLLVSGHWASVTLWILTVVIIVGLLLLTRTIQGPEQYRDAHPVSFLGGLSAAVMAVVILVLAIRAFGTDLLFTSLLGFAAGLSLLVISFCRLSGRKPLFLFHALLAVFFAMRMVSQYQHWNSDPQIQDYVFYLSAYIALMLTSYQQAAFDAGMGNHWALWCVSLIAVYLCCVSLSNSADVGLLLVSGIWAFTNLTNLHVRPRRQRPALNLDDQPSQEEV